MPQYPLAGDANVTMVVAQIPAFNANFIRDCPDCPVLRFQSARLACRESGDTQTRAIVECLPSSTRLRASTSAATQRAAG